MYPIISITYQFTNLYYFKLHIIKFKNIDKNIKIFKIYKLTYYLYNTLVCK